MPDHFTGKRLITFLTSLKEGGILPFYAHYQKVAVHILYQRTYTQFLFRAILPIHAGDKRGKAGETDYIS
jgi:hypothetical protein